MHRRTIAVALAVLLIASTVVVLVQQDPHLAAGSPALHTGLTPTPSVTTLSAEIYDGNGVPTTTFEPGYDGYTTLCFRVSDSDTSQTEVNVTITDPNATRDAVPSPAFSYLAKLNTTTHEFNSYTADVCYTFPLTILYNEVWTVNFSESASNYVVKDISLVVYEVAASSSVGDESILPGESYTVFWNLYSTANGESAYTHATSAYITGTYDANGTTTPLFTPANYPLSGASSGAGEWKATVPLNAVPDTTLAIEVYANASISGVTVENESAYVDVDVGYLVISGGLSLAPPYCNLFHYTDFAVGSSLAGCVATESDYYGDLTPIPDLPVKVGYWNGTATVTPSGAPTSLTTNGTGEVAFTFNAPVPPFAKTVHSYIWNSVNYTVTVPGADTTGYSWTEYDNLTFLLQAPSALPGVVNVTLDKTQYFVGATATATWSIYNPDPSKTGTITAVQWGVYSGNGATLSITPMTTTAQSGTFSVPVTEAMLTGNGYFEVYVYAVNATDEFEGEVYGQVLAPQILLSSSANYYTAGSTLSDTPTLEGGGAGATLQYTVAGEWARFYTNISSGTVANGSPIHVSIPTTNPPRQVDVAVWATAADGAVIAINDTDFYLEYGYDIQFGVSTSSSYADGSFQPGQSVSLAYAIVPVGGAPPPTVITVFIEAQGYPSLFAFPNVGPSGTLSFTIPSNAVQGILLVELEVSTELGGPCLPTGDCSAYTTVPINPHPSVLGLELGAGSGVTVGWVIVLVLVLVVGAAVALLLLKLRGGKGRMGGSSGSGGGTQAKEWKQPGASGADAPPPSGGPPSSPPPGASG